MSDLKAIQEERISLFRDVYDSKIPKRVPINVNLGFEATAQAGGLDMISAQWKPSLVGEAAEKVGQTLFTDVAPTIMPLRLPAFYEVLQAQSWVMGANGFMQHPEVTGMVVEDYDYLIEKPYDCLVERVIPRQFKSLKLDNPVQMAINLAKSFTVYGSDVGECLAYFPPLIQKFGYYPGHPTGFTEAPFDFLADQLRGFKEISMDIRRMPEKVAEACEALAPIVFKKGLPAASSPYARVFFPLHMPTFMREKDFASLFWPSFKKVCDTYASLGIGNQLFCEDNWMRYLDYLYDLPTNTVLIFEYGDLKQIKERLGKKHIIAGLYPVGLLKTGTKEACLDKAKEMLDVLAPGGKYIFSMDKIIITTTPHEFENLCAVTEYVRDNGAYSNAGASAGPVFKKEDYTAAEFRPLVSQYYSTWDQYKAVHPKVSDLGAGKLQALEERMFNYLVSLLI